MTPREALRRARARIEHPDRWTQEVGARTEQGRPVEVTDPRAASWCVLGALQAETGEPIGPVYTPACDALRAEAERDGRETVSDVNDQDGHAAALALMDRAIARLW